MIEYDIEAINSRLLEIADNICGPHPVPETTQDAIALLDAIEQDHTDQFRQLCELQRQRSQHDAISRRADAIFAAAFVSEFYDPIRRGEGPQVDQDAIERFDEEAESVAEMWREYVESKVES